MTTPKPKLTSEAREVAAGIRDQQITKAAIAEQLDVSPGLVSQWASGRTPVPADTAPRLGRILGREPSAISAAYREVRTAQAKAPTRDSLNGDVPAIVDVLTAHSEAIDDIRMLLIALLSIMPRYRLAEADALAALLRRQIPRSRRDQGFAAQLLEVLSAK